jgi:uncharacterized RDD family membrane protein YckC
VGNRIAAGLIDVVVVFVLWLPLVWVLDRLVAGDGLAFVALIVLALIYGSVMESRWQGTLGFKANRLRVLQQDGSNLSLLQGFIRSLLRLLLSGTLVTWLVPVVTKRKRALWDYPAGAFVVGHKRDRREDELAGVVISQEID